MKSIIAKEFRWEMSHRLPFHDGPCRNIHGHSYKIRVEIEGIADEHGMVMDYYEIEKNLRPILSKLDHGFICDSSDDALINFLKEHELKYMVIKRYTTAENLAAYLLSEITPLFKRHEKIERLKIRLYETEDVFAEAEIIF